MAARRRERGCRVAQFSEEPEPLSEPPSHPSAIANSPTRLHTARAARPFGAGEPLGTFVREPGPAAPRRRRRHITPILALAPARVGLSLARNQVALRRLAPPLPTSGPPP